MLNIAVRPFPALSRRMDRNDHFDRRWYPFFVFYLFLLMYARTSADQMNLEITIGIGLS